MSESGAGNDHKLWEAQISRMARAIRYYLRKNFPVTEQEAEDLAQDTLKAAIERVREHDFALDPGALLTTFVHSIAKHKAMDYIKYKRVRNHPSLDDAKSKIKVVVDPEQQMAGADCSKLRNLIDRLPHSQGQILHLIYYKGYKVADVAAEMKISAAQISTLKFTALQQLREWCQEEGITLAVIALALWNLWRLIHGL